MFPQDLVTEATRLIADFAQRGHMVATAESCTGGLVFGLLTEVAGSSAVMDRGFVTYSYAAKTDMLGVDKGMVERDGAVSAAVAEAMVLGALAHSAASMAVAITGIAGPTGGTASKPVGLVHFAAAARGRKPILRECRFGESLGRQAIRLATVREALGLLREVGRDPPT